MRTYWILFFFALTVENVKASISDSVSEVSDSEESDYVSDSEYSDLPRRSHAARYLEKVGDSDSDVDLSGVTFDIEEDSDSDTPTLLPDLNRFARTSACDPKDPVVTYTLEPQANDKEILAWTISSSPAVSFHNFLNGTGDELNIAAGSISLRPQKSDGKWTVVVEFKHHGTNYTYQVKSLLFGAIDHKRKYGWTGKNDKHDFFIQFEEQDGNILTSMSIEFSKTANDQLQTFFKIMQLLHYSKEGSKEKIVPTALASNLNIEVINDAFENQLCTVEKLGYSKQPTFERFKVTTNKTDGRRLYDDLDEAKDLVGQAQQLAQNLGSSLPTTLPPTGKPNPLTRSESVGDFGGKSEPLSPRKRSSSEGDLARISPHTTSDPPVSLSALGVGLGVDSPPPPPQHKK